MNTQFCHGETRSVVAIQLDHLPAKRTRDGYTSVISRGANRAVVIQLDCFSAKRASQ